MDTPPERFRIRTRYQRETFAVSLANELKKNPDPKVQAVGECIGYVLGAPIELVTGAVVKLIRTYPELGDALNLEVR